MKSVFAAEARAEPVVRNSSYAPALDSALVVIAVNALFRA
jgi:hypothetical protein